MLKQLLEHHILANLTFLLVLAIGTFAYLELPREQDPSVNFNWVDIKTYWPGAAASDVEKRITEPLEDGLEKVSDVKFVSSTSRPGISSILVRFEELDDDEFDTRVADLRREIQAKADELPAEVEQSQIFELNSSNVLPTATLIIWGQANDNRLQEFSKQIKDELERLDAVERVVSTGYRDPELHVNFLSSRLTGLGVSPIDAADSVAAYFQDLAAGSVSIGDQNWLIRLTGTTHDPKALGRFPIVTSDGELPLNALAEVVDGRTEPTELVFTDNHPTVQLWIYKKEKTNNLELMEQINALVKRRNQVLGNVGLGVAVLDDQTVNTKRAISVMEHNALIGLLLVLVTVAVFLGVRIAVVTAVGIPFVLAGTFAVVLLMGQTLNSAVLVAVVISLGMLIDDAVVVVEAIHAQFANGVKGYQAARNALSEVAAPVTTAVLTTIAAFLPLMLMPGILGQYMQVVPIVVSVALLISLIEAFWMLPSHTVALARPQRTRSPDSRSRAAAALRRRYGTWLIKVVRRPKSSLLAAAAVLLLAITLGLSVIKIDFFASDYYRLFYVNVDMPAGTSLEKTAQVTRKVETTVREQIPLSDIRGMVSYAGRQVTDTETLSSNDRGQVFVSLLPADAESLPLSDLLANLKPALARIAGPRSISFQQTKTGPPTTKAINIKVRGNVLSELREISAILKDRLAEIPGIENIKDDDSSGGSELSLRLDPDAIVRAGIHPADVVRLLRLFTDGEQVASMQHEGEKVFVRVRMRQQRIQDIDEFLAYPVHVPGAGEIALGDIVDYEPKDSISSIRHYNFRRAITVQADIDPSITDTVSANAMAKTIWNDIRSDYPGVSLDFSGELDDIKESLGSMAILSTVGVLLMFLILATQFKSYLQPLLILTTVPMALTWVVIGLTVSGHPMSLFTLYGAIALIGIAANDAIVMISTANRMLRRGHSVAAAAVRAARRRLMPIIVTTLTTIAGLFSLAVGLGGKSLMWGPIANAIVWGLGVSTVLTLFLMPLLYSLVSRRRPMNVAAWDNWLEPESEGLGYRLLGALRARLPGETSAESAPTPAAQPAEHPSASRYDEGVNALKSGDFETAIRIFEDMAKREPSNLDLNLLAARANVSMIERIGWDIGYIARAERFLNRAKAIDAQDIKVSALADRLDELNDGAQAAAEKPGE